MGLPLGTAINHDSGRKENLRSQLSDLKSHSFDFIDQVTVRSQICDLRFCRNLSEASKWQWTFVARRLSKM